MERICRVCGSDTKMKCSRCHSVYYCGSEHQLQDWPEHRLTCGVTDREGTYRATDREDTGDTSDIKPVDILYIGSGPNPGYTPETPDQARKTAEANQLCIHLAFPHVRNSGVNVEEFHRQGKRCFVSVEIEYTLRDNPIPDFHYVVKEVSVRTDAEEHAKAVGSTKLCDYVQNYDTKTQIAVTVWCKEPNACYSSLIIQPWLY